MFDRRPHAIEDLKTKILGKLQSLVGGLEEVVLGILGVEMHERENEMRINDALTTVPKRPVVRSCRIAPHRLDVGVVVANGARIKARRTAR